MKDAPKKEEKPEPECPHCGNTKHHEIVKIQTETGATESFRCKSCGHTENKFTDFDPEKQKQAVERMGDAFRDFLKKSKKN